MRKIFYFCCISIALTLGCVNSETIHLKDDEVGIIGYGSLTSIESMERTLGRKYTGEFKVVELTDWKRNWRIWMPNDNHKKMYFTIINNDTIIPERILYLNIDSIPGEKLNCCLFVIKKSELADFDKREWIYRRADVTDKIKRIKIKNGTVYAYTALEQYKIKESPRPIEYSIRKSYLEVLDTAFNDLGHKFKIDYINTTEPFDSNLIISDFVFN